ncbi:MAG: YlbF family regulator [Oscillospiraceae bacterium]|nr:YlbF family regulator [Oscillospiraceae bacterium]MBQ8379080.1 YlbF family regulator [Oscillospiraceae bacterium]MBQ8883264.1 YlbF family regulator [Oscillospiraceae bacterium]
MNVIELARQLGVALQADERFKTFTVAKENNDNDAELQEKIAQFNDLRRQLNMEMSKDEKDAEAMKSLDGQIKNIYGEIMTRPSMIEYNKAREAMDKLLDSVNFIITMAANGEDPMTCPEEQPHSCSGSCSTCGGCH